jgi:hypothetical protein
LPPSTTPSQSSSSTSVPSSRFAYFDTMHMVRDAVSSARRVMLGRSGTQAPTEVLATRQVVPVRPDSHGQ